LRVVATRQHPLKEMACLGARRAKLAPGNVGKATQRLVGDRDQQSSHETN